MPTPSRRRSALVILAAVGLAGALGRTAAAAPATISVSADQFTPSAVSIAVGESVTWNFTELSHNVKGTGWSGNDGFGKGTFTKTFSSAGSFAFVCEAHADRMKDTVTVTGTAAPAADPSLPAAAGNLAGNGNGPGAVPAGAWLFPAAPDLRAPVVESVSVSAPAAAARPRLRVRLSEDALVVVATRRAGAAGKLPSTRRPGTRGANGFALAPRGLRPGHYRLRVAAIDAAGNESPVRVASFRVRH
jgi:plastocyanin